MARHPDAHGIQAILLGRLLIVTYGGHLNASLMARKVGPGSPPFSYDRRAGY